MATIKSYTDISQSKTLSKILPLESADMCYEVGEDLDGYITKTIYTPLMHTPYNDDYIPCWSLAALFYTLPILDNRSPVISKTFDGKYRVVYHSTAYEKAILTSDYDNPVDACVNMILKLHELNLL